MNNDMSNSQKPHRVEFNVNHESFTEEITLFLSPSIRIIDSEYMRTLDDFGECHKGGMIDVFYRIEYFDIVQEKTKIDYLSEPFTGKWEMRKPDS